MKKLSESFSSGALWLRFPMLLMLLCACAVLTHAQTAVTYRPAEGKSGLDLVSNQYGHYSMQAAHEDWNVIYAKAGTISLKRRNDTFRSYARWYNYDTNATMAALTLSETADYTSDNGAIRTRANGEVTGFTASYVYDGTSVVRIACDQSAYNDYNLTGTTFTEPTISQRIIYEIRPASEMAHMVDASTADWLEEYSLIAPTGQTIYLGPKYTFNSNGDYPCYFFNETAPSWMNTTAFTGSSSSSTEGAWEGTVTDNTTTIVYKCINAYGEPSSSNGTVTMNRTKKVDDLMSGSFTNNGYTWNYTRTYADDSKNGVAPGYTSLLGMRFGDSGKDNTGEHVVFTVSGIPGTIKTVTVTGSSVPSDAKTSNTHSVSVKVGGSSFGTTKNMSLVTDDYPFTGSASGSLEITFKARKRRSVLYIKSITVTYEITGTGQSYAVGDELTTEPSASFRNNWKKVETRVVSTDWKKIDVQSSGNSAGWNWTVDNVAQASPSTFSGQFIRATSSSVGEHTYQLTYTDGGGATTTMTSTKSDQVTTVTEYNYVSGWTQSSQTSNTVITTPESSSQVTTGGNGGTGKVFKIAKFKVNYMDKTKVGPYLITDYAYLSAAEKIAEQDFNFNTPGVSTTTYYTHPLSVEESTFGFYYGSSSNRSKSDTYWNEYCFVNNGYGWKAMQNMSNHVGDSDGYDATKGYALYTDGSQKPGTVFSLNFDAELCAGAKMYFSAWIGDQNNGTYSDDRAPIFDFIVVGVDAAGNETNLTTFTTGIFNMSGWKRILFPLEFNSNVDFDKYLLRVVNKAATTSGNDFFIDDIAVYLQKAPIVPIQASTPNDKCIDVAADLVLYTRVDYDQVETSSETGSSSTRKFYYRWINEAGEGIVTDKYLNPVEGNTAGTIIVPERESAITAAGSQFDHSDADFAAFDANHNTTDSPVCRFIKEDCTNRDGSVTKRYVVYVATPIEVQLGIKYKCVIASSVEDLGANNDCSSSAVVEVSNGMRINSTKMGGMVKTFDKSACANYSYDLRLSIEYAVVSGSNTVNKSCDYLAHWLFGKEPAATDETAVADFLALYGASFSDITDALSAYDSDNASAAQEALIQRLVQKGLLVLAETLDQTNPVYNVTPLVTNTFVSYTAFPVRRLCDDAPECHDPKSITLFFDDENPNVQRNAVYFVKAHNETGIPQFVLSRPRRVRVLEKVDVKTVLLDLTDRNNTYRFKSIVLYATDDDAFRASINKDAVLTYSAVAAAGTAQTVVSSSTDGVRFAGLAQLAAGHSYTFKLGYEVLTEEEGKEQCTDDNGKKHDGEAFITFLIVPELLTFTGEGISAAWNDDYNWTYTRDGEESIVYAPLDGTSIIFLSGDHILLNRTYGKFQESALEPGALPYISYDINYQPYTCNNVYVPAQTALTGQSNVTSFGKWTFDMPVTAEKWILTAMPVKGIVSGDMFIPTTGESDDDVFAVKAISQTVGQPAVDRTDHPFYNSLYNQIASQKDVTGSVDITSSTWTLATNSLNTPFGPGYGWALGYNRNLSGQTIRLPKVDTEYHFFNAGGYWHAMTQTADRTDVGRPAYTADNKGEMSVSLHNNTASEYFLLGNPTFGYIDLAALKAANPSISAFYTAGLETGRYSLVTATTDREQKWIATLSGFSGMLAPMHSIFVKTTAAATDLSVKISDKMLRTSDRKYEDNGAVRAGAPRRLAAEQDEKAIYIAASALDFRSTAAVFESDDASNDAAAEDVELYMLDKTKTPFSIFTIAGNTALAINRIGDADVVPLAMFSEYAFDSVAVAFSGADAYLSDWDLVDRQSSFRAALSDSLSLTLQMPLNGGVRYYLEHARHTFDMQDALDHVDVAVRAYCEHGVLTVFSDTDMTGFRIYDAAGRLIVAQANAGRLISQSLPKGVYVVRTNAEVLKVIVK